jgi:hypothetical protein
LGFGYGRTEHEIPQQTPVPSTLASTLMRHFSIIILALLLASCFDNKIKFEKEYYEKITRIKFPEKYTVLETFDNGEFLTGTVFQMDSVTLLNFIIENHFDTVRSYLDTHIMSENYLKTNKPTFNSTQSLYFISKSEKKINWTYIADLKSNRLWTEISYPDWGGQ